MLVQLGSTNCNSEHCILQTASVRYWENQKKKNTLGIGYVSTESLEPELEPKSMTACKLRQSRPLPRVRQRVYVFSTTHNFVFTSSSLLIYEVATCRRCCYKTGWRPGLSRPGTGMVTLPRFYHEPDSISYGSNSAEAYAISGEIQMSAVPIHGRRGFGSR